MADRWTVKKRIAVTGACASVLLIPLLGTFVLATSVAAGTRATEWVPASSDALARFAMIAGCAGALVAQLALLALVTGSALTALLWVFGWRREW